MAINCVISGEDCQVDDFDLQEVARIGYADMLHDDARNRKYLAAISATVESFVNSDIRPLRIVDIGTGTGLLSMMAVRKARELNIPVAVTAFEYFPPMVKCARQVILDNGYESEITVIGMKSDSHPGFKPEEKADILITELFDTELIGEGALHSYRHAIKYFMKSDFVAVPSKAKVWIQVVESKELRQYNQFNPEVTNYLEDDIKTKILSCVGPGILHDLQLSQLKPEHDFKAVSSPEVAFEFDFTSLNGLKLREEKSIQFRQTISSLSKTVILFWWDLKMSEFDDTILSMAPYFDDLNTKEWREHWIQALYYPSLDVSCKDSDLVLRACHDDFSFWFSWSSRSDVINADRRAQPLFCSCGYHLHFSRNRLKQLNQMDLITTNVDTLGVVFPSNVLFIGDFSLIPLQLARRYQDINIYCLWDNDFLKSFSREFTNLSVVSSSKMVSNIDFVVSETYFSSNDLPCDGLDFWYKCLDDSEIVKLSDDRVMPNRVIFKCLLVQFDDLWKIRSEVGSVLGFDLTHFDRLVLDACDKCDDDFEAQPLWEYPGKAIQDPFVAFDWTWSQFRDMIQLQKQEIVSEEICLLGIKRDTLLVFWTEFWFYDVLIHSNGPVEPVNVGSYIQWRRTVKQGINFISRLAVSQNLNCRLKYSFRSGKNRKLSVEKH